MAEKKISIRRRSALKQLHSGGNVSEAQFRTLNKMFKSDTAPSGVRYSEMTGKELDNRIKKEIEYETAKNVRASKVKEDRYKLKKQAKEGNEIAGKLSKAKPQTTKQKLEVKKYNKDMAAKRAMIGSEKKLKAMASDTAKIRLSKSRRGMIGQPIGGGMRNPNLKK